jgi:hypothetical protein
MNEKLFWEDATIFYNVKKRGTPDTHVEPGKKNNWRFSEMATQMKRENATYEGSKRVTKV